MSDDCHRCSTDVISLTFLHLSLGLVSCFHLVSVIAYRFPHIGLSYDLVSISLAGLAFLPNGHLPQFVTIIHHNFSDVGYIKKHPASMAPLQVL